MTITKQELMDIISTWIQNFTTRNVDPTVSLTDPIFAWYLADAIMHHIDNKNRRAIDPFE